MSESIGQKLRRVRTERKLTLEQVAHATHIRLHYLQALEENQPDIMPSDAQGRGFLRLYAGYLNLPVQPMLDAWPDQLIVEIEEPVAKDTADTAPDLPPAAPATVAQEAETLIVEDAAPGPQPQEQENTKTRTASDTTPTSTISPPAPVSSQEIFHRVGDALRQQRESLSLSLADVENHTHIRRHYLESIESGHTADLPSPAQGRGMLKNYAQFLNMNVDAVLLEYAEGLQTRRLEKAVLQKPTPANKSNTASPIIPAGLKKWITPDMIVGVSAIILLVVIIVWGISQVTAARELASEPTAPPIAEVLLNDNSAELAAAPDDEAAAATRSPEESNAAIPQTSEALDFDEEAEAIPVLDNAPLQLYLVASQRAWIRVTTDDEISFEGRVVPGNAYSYSAAEKIDLLTGNASALKVFFNQQELGILGEVGEVVTVSFTAAGMIVPTPQIPPTPTETQIPPTSTPAPTSDAVQPTPTVTPFIP